jgi:hypothetical protein
MTYKIFDRYFSIMPEYWYYTCRTMAYEIRPWAKELSKLRIPLSVLWSKCLCPSQNLTLKLPKAAVLEGGTVWEELPWMGEWSYKREHSHTFWPVNAQQNEPISEEEARPCQTWNLPLPWSWLWEIKVWKKDLVYKPPSLWCFVTKTPTD